jgi:hypothetical protein
LGGAFVRTLFHFWPRLRAWLDQMPDTRFQPYVEYRARFLSLWGILLFVLKLGSRRQLDYDLRDLETSVLPNMNRLAGTAQTSLPVVKTLAHFLEHVGLPAWEQLRTRLVVQLIRAKVLQASRVRGYYMVAVDGTGQVTFGQPHCPHCLVFKQKSGRTDYVHMVLEAKLLGQAGLALSLASEFIENPQGFDPADEDARQDCELNAFGRLVVELKRLFPQLRLCLTNDSLYACGPAIQACEDRNWAYVFTFKEGRLPDLWREFQALLKECPENTLRLQLPDHTVQVYRWVNALTFQDSQQRVHPLNAIQCHETSPEGQTSTFAWVTNLPVNSAQVVEIATKGGRRRSQIENQGFNVQKNSGLNLEHPYSHDPHLLKIFYVLLQIGHTFVQLFEKGSLLKRLAHQRGKTLREWLGSLKNVARRLLESFRYFLWPADAFTAADRIQIRLDTS